MEKRNILSVSFKQDTFKTVTRKGVKTQMPVKHSVEFTESTPMGVNSANFSDWLIGRLLNYQLLQKLQGEKERFDTSLPIEMTISVNNNNAAAKIKFSTNPTTLKRNLEQYPTVVAAVFNPQTLAFGTSRDNIINIAKGVVAEIAPACTPDQLLNELETVNDAPVEPETPNLEQFEDAEVINDDNA